MRCRCYLVAEVMANLLRSSFFRLECAADRPAVEGEVQVWEEGEVQVWEEGQVQVQVREQVQGQVREEVQVQV